MSASIPFHTNLLVQSSAHIESVPIVEIVEQMCGGDDAVLDQCPVEWNKGVVVYPSPDALLKPRNGARTEEANAYGR